MEPSWLNSKGPMNSGHWGALPMSFLEIVRATLYQLCDQDQMLSGFLFKEPGVLNRQDRKQMFKRRSRPRWDWMALCMHMEAL